jgi:hypothetical protein
MRSRRRLYETFFLEGTKHAKHRSLRQLQLTHEFRQRPRGARIHEAQQAQRPLYGADGLGHSPLSNEAASPNESNAAGAAIKRGGLAGMTVIYGESRSFRATEHCSATLEPTVILREGVISTEPNTR